MQFLFRVIILFLIVFNFRVPMFYNSAFVSIVLCTIYYIYKRGSIPFTCFFQRYNAVILIGTVVLAFIVVIIAYLHQQEVMNTREKRTWIEFMMLWAMVYALPLLVEGKESTAFKELALLICYAFALQGAIGLAAVIYPPFGDFLISLKPKGFIETELTFNKFRYYNLSGILLVELTAAFGVALMAFFWVQLRSTHPYLNGWKKYVVFTCIFFGTMFSGRTGFIGLLMGLGGWMFFSFNRIFMFFKRNLSYTIGFTMLLLIIFFFVFTPKQRRSFTDEVFPFAFEWYYNYRDYGKFEVASAEATSKHYYYLHDETLLHGHGIDAFGGHFYLYPHSDAGYTNVLVFGGIPFLVCLIIYQCLYSVRPMSIALRNNSPNDRIHILFFILLFIYIFIVEIKAPAVGYLHIVEVMYLAIGSAYIMQQYSKQEEQDELTG